MTAPSTHIVLTRRHWPAMLHLVAPGDELILGGDALFCAVAQPDLSSRLAERGVARACYLSADANAMGLTVSGDLEPLTDDEWVQAVIACQGSLVQW